MNLDEALQALDDLARGEDRPGVVEVHVLDDRAEIRLVNPRSRNALTFRMMSQLARAVGRLRDRPPAWVLLEAAPGPAFCAGGHLDSLTKRLVDPDAARTMAEAMGAVLDALRTLPAVSVSLVEGAAIGGGLEVALSTDWIWASPAASFVPAQVGLGIAPGWGGHRRSVLRLGATRALDLWLDPSPRSAERSLALGWIDRVCPDPGLSFRQWLSASARPPAAVRAIKLQSLAARGATEVSEAEAFASVWGSEGHRAALRAAGRAWS